MITGFRRASAPEYGEGVREGGIASRGGLVLAAALAAACSGGSPGPVFHDPSSGEVLGLTQGGGGSGPRVGRGEIVAELEIALPAEQSFLLRGTLPVPPGTVMPGSLVVPLAVAQPDGSAARTQVEIVSSYPNPEDGADVVEVLARVERPSGASTGERVRYGVAFKPHAERDIDLDSDVRALFDGANRLTLRTHDVFGHSYTADLFRDVQERSGELELLRKGEIAKEFLTHEILLPVQPQGGGQGTMPHLMGVHSFIRFWEGEPFFSLDLHVHNGMSGNDPSDPADDALDKIYFRELELGLPSGWKVLYAFENPFEGNPYTEGSNRIWPIVRPMAGGKMHVMPRQSRMIRRLAIVKQGHEERARAMLEGRNLAFCVPGTSSAGHELWSWWNESTARYFPQSHLLPSLDHVGLEFIREQKRNKLAAIGAQVATGSEGSYPFTEAGLGWAHPWGVQYGGMTGGDEIWLWDGVDTAAAASQEGYRLAELVSRLYIDRQPTALFDKTGRPTRVESWLNEQGQNGPWMPMYFHLTPHLPNDDPFGFNDAPTFQSAYVAQSGKQPFYEGRLAGFMPIDHQHYIRYTRNLKVLAWLGNDSVAKKELEAAAELFRLGFHPYPNSNYGHVQGSGLLAKIQYVDEYPGRGLGFGRGESWGVDTVVSAYRTGDREFRARYYPWFRTVAGVLREAQSTCTGCIMAAPSTNYLDGLYRIRQSYETAITENMLVGMRESVFRGKNDTETARIDEMLLRSVRASISPVFWNEGLRGPWNFIAVGPIDSTQPLFCNDPPDGATSPNADHNQYWSSLAYAYEISPDDVFLFRAAEMAGGGDLLHQLESSGLGNLGNRAALLALMQRIGQMP